MIPPTESPLSLIFNAEELISVVDLTDNGEELNIAESPDTVEAEEEEIEVAEVFNPNTELLSDTESNEYSTNLYIDINILLSNVNDIDVGVMDLYEQLVGLYNTNNKSYGETFWNENQNVWTIGKNKIKQHHKSSGYNSKNNFYHDMGKNVSTYTELAKIDWIRTDTNFNNLNELYDEAVALYNETESLDLFDIYYESINQMTELYYKILDIHEVPYERGTIEAPKDLQDKDKFHKWPTPKSKIVTSNYGNRKSPIRSGYEMHTGIDIGPRKYRVNGDPIVATDSGIVVYAGINGSLSSGYGYTIQVDHGNGISTLYAHLSKMLVNVGDYVTKGQVIAEMGTTGSSTGTHLHFEIRKNYTSYEKPWSYLGSTTNSSSGVPHASKFSTDYQESLILPKVDDKFYTSEKPDILEDPDVSEDPEIVDDADILDDIDILDFITQIIGDENKASFYDIDYTIDMKKSKRTYSMTINVDDLSDSNIEKIIASIDEFIAQARLEF